MLAGQRALAADTYRGAIMGAGDLRLQDWFVPVLYQEEADPLLVTRVPSEEVVRLQARQPQMSFGALPEPPAHTFVGRSRELLALERLLLGDGDFDNTYAVVRGTGGTGKTTLAVELARWLVRSGHFRRAAFASVEHYTDARAVVDNLESVLAASDAAVLEDPESVLGESDDASALDPATAAAAAPVDELFEECRRLLGAHPATRLVFTSREPLPVPIDAGRNHIGIGALSRDDAVKLVEQVMAREGWQPPAADPGKTPEEVTALVEAVNRHPRALVLLAREVARRGVRATTDNLDDLMRELHTRYPEDRERSLFASVELSLRRLAPDMREQVRALAAFHGGAQLDVLARTLGVEVDEARELAIALIDVGLGDDMGHGHLRLDPALPAYVRGELDDDEWAALRTRWGQATAALVGFLCQQQFQDAQLAATLTLLELPNLLALLQWAFEDQLPPEQVVGLAGQVEELVTYLGRPRALERAAAVREAAAQGLEALGEWSHARYLTEAASIDRLLERGDLPAARAAAEGLLQRAMAAGKDAFPGAAYDIAMAHFRMGRVLGRMGAAEAALAPLAEAERRFQKLADAGNTDAERMAAGAITERAGRLSDLGRLDDAAAAYEEAIERGERRDDKRSVATNKFQLGTVRMLQGRYAEALAVYAEARDIFEKLGEPRSVATIWHQMGMVHRDAGQHEEAERAYRRALAIKVREGDRAGEAMSLGELGNLYAAMGRLEEAATFYRQAADVHVALRDRANEGRDRNNLAVTLIELGRDDEARRELERAIECKEPFGHAAEPWTTWAILHDLEVAEGNSYAAYRRAGGESRRPGTRLSAAVAYAIQQGETDQAEELLAQILADDPEPWAEAMIPKLQSILAGDRDPSLADDPALDFDDAAELRLLLEALGD